MKTFVLFALTLCVAQCEMSRKLITGQRSRSKLDQGSHHRPGVAGEERTVQQFLPKRFGQHKALPEFTSSSRVVFKEHGSGNVEYVMGNIADTDLSFSSGSSSGSSSESSSGFGSGLGSGSSLTVHISLTDVIKTEESQTEKESEQISTATHISRNNSSIRKAESSNSNGGIIHVLTMSSRKVKRSVDGFLPGSGDTGSGSSSGEMYPIGIQESSGSDKIEEVIISPQYVQGGSDSIATSIGSGSVACIGVGCDQGSGNIEIHHAQIKLANSSVQRNSAPGEESQSSGNYAVAHQP